MTSVMESIRAVAALECLCKGNIIPGGPCRHEIAHVMLKLVDAQTGALLHVEALDCGGAACMAPGRPRHAPGCRVDAALTLAGFPDQASRDAELARRAGR